jgi:alpha-glucuronidase
MKALRCIRAVFCVLAGSGLNAETGYDAWLRYARLDDAALQRYRDSIPAVLVATGDSPIVAGARGELIRGIRGMTGRTLRLESGLPREPAILTGTLTALRTLSPALVSRAPALRPGGYWLGTVSLVGSRFIVVAGADDPGVLYGAFALLRRIAMSETVAVLDEKESPYAPIRWVNQWDNLDGSIERGYGGRSIFWEAGRVRNDLRRVSDYGRILASLGVNGATIDNVNADKRLLSAEFIPQVARIAEAFRPWGVRVALSVDFGSPQSLGGLDTFDPLDPRVAAWWQARADELYKTIPDLAGFVLKADSEGRVGPSAYHRTHADAANVVARALKPHGGILLYRGFVYDHHMDWNNPKNDRARAAYDNFKPLDGQFDDNVVVQIKNGPIDFQVREPASPLFGALEKTNEAIELQVTQEYTGQAKHLVFLVPQWKEVLDFDLRVKAGGSPVKALAGGRTFSRPLGGFVGVANVGLDDSWMGNQLSQANLYGFGRLAWNPDLTSRRIVDEWTRLTFGNDPAVVRTVADMQLKSWPAYEAYTGPLGLQTLTDIVGDHYGVAVEASERNGWGQWHRADDQGVGMDRTVATGTGYVGQYAPAVARLYESLAACPDDLLLFLHHVPYGWKLHSGETVIQYLYDSHYQGAETAAGYAQEWRQLKGRIDDARFAEVLDQLEYQAGQAQVWRDAVCNWFLRASGIPDAKGRVGHHPHRVEAESMKLSGYTAMDVTPWEAASGGRAVTCPRAECAAAYRYTGPAGWFTIDVQYFDQPGGVAHFEVRVGDQTIDSWAADARNPARGINASSSSRRRIQGIALRPGDEIGIRGMPGIDDPAALDYLEILPQ